MAARAKADDRAGLALAGRGGVIAAAALFLLASYRGLTALALLAGASLLLAGLGWLSAWLSTWRVSYERRLSVHRGFPGETVEVEVRLLNRKPLPVPWLEVRETLPAALLPEDGSVRTSRLLHLPWRGVAKWRYNLTCRKRGAYTLGAAELRGGDPYGLATRAVLVPADDEVLVYPRLVPLAAFGLPARAIFGRQRPPRSLFEDPSRMAGLREYAPGDPFHRIDWKGTARHGALQVKVYEPTTTPQVLLILASEQFTGQAERESQGEEAISIAASLAHEGTALGWSVGIVANGSPPVALAPSAGETQVATILEGLARLDLQASQPLAAFLTAERPYLPAGCTMVFVVAAADSSLLAAAEELAFGGHAIAFVLVGDDAEAASLAGRWPTFAVTPRGGQT